MTKIQECLAKNIKLYRKILHLTQEQLAEKVETSTNYIGTIETGKKFPSPQMIEKIAIALDIESPQLFQSEIKIQVKEQIDLELFKKNIIQDIEKAIDKSLRKSNNLIR